MLENDHITIKIPKLFHVGTLFYQVGQANVKVSRRIADILYTE